MSAKDHEQLDAPFDVDSERPAELDELNFSDDEDGESFIDLAPNTEINNHDEQTRDDNPATPGDNPTLDDLSPETLIKEDGARSPHEPGADTPADKELSIVNKDEIGAGYGLDEAELARKEHPDKK